MRNLKACLVFAFLYLQVVYTQAQVFSFGIKGGLNYSNVYGDYSLENKMSTGVNAGAFANFNFTKTVGVISEINYEQKGFRYSSENIAQSELINGEKNLDYITIPILFKYQFGQNTKFYITIGSYLGILVYANDNGRMTDNTLNQKLISEWDNDIYFDTEDVDVGLSFGAGLQIPVNRKFGLILDGRYNSGLMMVEPDKIFVEEYRNVAFTLNLGVVYHLAY